MWGRLVDHAKAAAVEYSDNRQAPRGSSSAAAVSSATPAWDRLRSSLQESATTLLEQAQVEHGGQPAQAATNFLRTVGTAFVDAAERKVKQQAMPAASEEVLQLSLFATRLADAAYCSSVEEAQSALAHITGALELVHFRHQKDTLPQWLFIRRRDLSAIYIVFRGTASNDDVYRDLLFMPTVNGGLRFHSGFLAGVRNDPELAAALHAHLAGSVAHLYLVGHSLGGSLALALPAVTPSVIPSTHAGEVTVVAIGSPAVLHGPLDGGLPLAASSSSSSSSDAATTPPVEIRVGVAVRVSDAQLASSTSSASLIDRAIDTEVAAPPLDTPCMVHVHSLTARPDLNGCRGRADAFDAQTGRYHVAIEASDEQVALRRANLTPEAPPRVRVTAVGSEALTNGPVDVTVPGTPMDVPMGVPVLGTVLPPGAAALPPDARRCRAVLVVNAADAVPRLLGSPLPFATSTLLTEVIKQAAVRSASPEGRAEAAEKARTNAKELLDTLPKYVHLPQTEMVLLRASSAEALAVPPTERQHALHVHESLSINALAHHHLEEYSKNIEAALRAQPAQVLRARAA